MGDPSLTPELIHGRSFSTGFRGYEQAEVRQFLARVAAEIRELRERATQLESAWHSAEERAARPPVLDDDTLMSAVGEETANILRTARAAAADLRAKAAEEVEQLQADAKAQADRIRAEAEGTAAAEIRQAHEDAARVVDAARTQAADIIDKSRAEAEVVRTKAEQERLLTIEGATATRDRILDDLARRRLIASVQIEQLRAGRERLLESYGVVRRTLEEAHEALTRADAEARAAAEETGRRLLDKDPLEVVGRAASGDDLTPGGPGGRSDPATVAPAGDAPAALAPPSGPDAATAPAEPADQATPDSAASDRAEGAAPGAASGPATASIGSGPVLIDISQSAPSSGAPDPTDEADPTGATVPGSQVDVLFARIRASQAGPPSAAGVATATAVLDEADGSGGPATSTTETPDESDDSGARSVRSDLDESLLQRRESVVVDLEVALTRKLKRTLQDEQNALLDRLRNLDGEPSAPRLLPAPTEHAARYREATAPYLEKAAVAGVSFGTEVLGGKATRRGKVPDVADLASEAATSIVDVLRRRLEEAIASGEGDDRAVLIESLGAAYRECKSQRVERVAGDVLVAAFGRGTCHGVPEGTAMRWVVEDTDGPCADCDDDALAGTLPNGESFPTGQAHPPAHTGCRCLLVPVAG